MNYVTSLTELLAVTKATIQPLAVSDTDVVAEFHRRVALRCRCDESGGGNQGDMMRGRNSEATGGRNGLVAVKAAKFS